MVPFTLETDLGQGVRPHTPLHPQITGLSIARVAMGAGLMHLDSPLKGTRVVRGLEERPRRVGQAFGLREGELR